MNNNKLVPIGVLNKTHGIKGEFKAFLYNIDSNTLVPGILIWLKIYEKYQSYKIKSIRGIIKKLIIKLEDINSIEDSKILFDELEYKCIDINKLSFDEQQSFLSKNYLENNNKSNGNIISKTI